MVLVAVLSTSIFIGLSLYWFAEQKPGKGQRFAIISAIQQRDKTRLRLLAAQPRHREVRTQEGDTPLHIVTRLNAVEMAHILLEAGVDPNVQNNHGYTPLMIAADRGYSRMAHVLLSGGANPAYQSRSGKTAGELATSKNHKDLIYLLDQTSIHNGSMVS
ncbi:MAG: ankyrin repeat domain-containing protein [Bacteroidota bacterium]